MKDKKSDKAAEYLSASKGRLHQTKTCSHLHLAVDHPGVLALSVDVMDLGEVVLLPEVGVEDVVEVDGEDVEEAARSSSVDGVAGVVGVGPGVGPVGQGPVGQQVQHLLVGVLLAAQEDEVLQSVGQTVIVQRLKCLRKNVNQMLSIASVTSVARQKYPLTIGDSALARITVKPVNSDLYFTTERPSDAWKLDISRQ